MAEILETGNARVVDRLTGLQTRRPHPDSETRRAIRGVLDDSRLSWAIWPAGRPSPG